MQIISGKYKHLSFDSPNSEKTHPMGNREKLAIFNMLTGQIENRTVLDAFAGTGALGLEALSLGARSATFIEKSPKIAKILKNNIEKILKDEKEKCKIIVSDIKHLNIDEKFDIIFADPPYDIYSVDLLEPLVSLLNGKGIFVVSMPESASTPALKNLEEISRRKYAAASIVLFKKIK